MYRLYLQTQQGNRVKPENTEHEDLNKILEVLPRFKQEGYYSYLIIKNVGNGDELVTSR